MDRRDSYFQRGKKYFQDKKYVEASIEFQNAVKIDPHFAEGYYYLGLTERNRGDLQSAFQALSREMEVDPKQIPGALELANLCLIGNQPARAHELANDVLTREPGNFSALLIVAQSDLGQKNYKQAMEELKKVEAIRPTDAPIYLAMGIAQLGGGDSDAAESSFGHAIRLDPASPEGYRDLANLYQEKGNLSSAERTLQQGLKATASRPDLYYALADFYCRRGRVLDAQSVLRSLEKVVKPTAELYSRIGDFWVAHDELQPALDEYQAAYAFSPSLLLRKKVVNAYITLNNPAEADRWNREILKADPKDPEGRLFAGAIAQLIGDNAAAAVQLRKVLDDNPESVFAHYYLGTAFMALGEDDDAKTQFFDCLKTDPTFSFAIARLAELSLRAKDAQGAAQYAAEVMRLDPFMADGYLLSADAAILSGDTARAKEALRLADQFVPDSAALIVRQAMLDGLEKNYAKSEREYQSALTRVKDPTPILAGLAQIYVQQKQTAKAIQEIGRYANGSQTNSELFVLLAQLHIQENNLSAADADCQNALHRNGKNARAYFYLARIAELQGHDDMAIENYARAAEDYPSDSYPDLLAGDLSVKLRRWSDAQKYYQQALRQSPGMARAQAGLARTMIELGQDSNVALGLAQQALSSAASDPVVAEDLGWVYFKKGLPQLAIPLLRQATEQMPDVASFHFDLGMAYSAAGEDVAARRALLDARNKGLSGPDARQAEQTMALLSAPAKQ